MFGIVFRMIWRVLIFAIGAAVVWLAIFRIYPYAHQQLPAVVVLLLLYCMFAYMVIPALIRLFRLFIKPNHIPLYVTTGDGWAADPVNIAVVAHSQKQFIKAMEDAGWYLADKTTFKSTLREAYSIIFNQSYPRAPFSNLYLFDQPFDLGFQKSANDKMSARSRHHVRFWEFGTANPAHETTHFKFWHKHLRHLLHPEKKVWIGAAIDDTGPVGIRWRYGQLTHRNNPDTNLERDLIIGDLEKANYTKSVEVIQAGKPFSFRGQTLGNNFVCDGTIKVVGLKKPLVKTITGRLASKKR